MAKSVIPKRSNSTDEIDEQKYWANLELRKATNANDGSTGRTVLLLLALIAGFIAKVWTLYFL